MADILDIVTREARERITAALPDLAQAIVPVLVEAALKGQDITEVKTPVTPTPTPTDAKADAKDRAWRTLLQGLGTTVLLGGGGALYSAIDNPNFNIFELSSWTTALNVAAAAAAMSVLAYVQRLVQPPKES